MFYGKTASFGNVVGAARCGRPKKAPLPKGAGFFNRLRLKKTGGFFYKLSVKFNGIGFLSLSHACAVPPSPQGEGFWFSRTAKLGFGYAFDLQKLTVLMFEDLS